MPINETFAQRLEPIIEELVRHYSTPFHIYDAAGIIETHKSMVNAFGDWPFQQHFAVKSLPNPAVLKMLVQVGSGLDCASLTELRLAEACGAVGDAVVFTSNNTSQSEYDEALAAGALVTFDDLRHMQRVEQLPSIVAFRVSPQGSPTQSVLMGGAEGSKFGVPREEIVDAYREALRRGASRFGIHGMACANELDVGKAICAAQDLVEFAAVISKTLGITFDYINFGGGLGIPYRLEDKPFNFGEYALAIRTAIAEAFPGQRLRVLMECGRYVSGPHGILVSCVINRMKKEREIAGLDASMSALMRPGFYREAYHHITLPFSSQRPKVVVDVVGSLCENIDRFAVARTLPDPREGDIVYIHDTGAHGHSMGFNYNGRLRPAELMLTGAGDIVEIRRPETYGDYVATVQWEPVPLPSFTSKKRSDFTTVASTRRSAAL